MHSLLGVDRAAVGTGAALDAAAGVAVDRAAAVAERGSSLHRQLPIASHLVGIELGDPEEVLRLGEILIEVLGPGDAELVAPAVEDPVWGAETGAGVDHGRAADDFRHWDRNRRTPVGDRQAGVAIQLG